MILRRPVFSATMPVTAASLFRQRIDQKEAFQRFAGNHEALNALEIPAGLFVGVSGRAGDSGSRKLLPPPREWHATQRAFPLRALGKYRKDASFENLEVEARLRRGRGSLLRMRRRPAPQREATDDQRRS